MRRCCGAPKSTDKSAAILTAGTSKWNRIEHYLFCRTTQNWGGRLLTDRSTVVELVGKMTTKGAPQGRVRVLRGRP
jgi:hypothetical protein